MRKKIIIFLIIILLLIVFIFLKYVNLIGGPFVKIGQTKIFVEIADTEEKRIKGLSGRESLAANQGMLFIFPQPGYYTFWMPEMNFPIDIIWFDEEKRIIGIENNVSNKFDPQNPQLYRPPAPVLYVLEIKAGLAEQNQIRVGDIVIFSKIIENKIKVLKN
ncbi:MAG: DUF192 domain-containing protein [Minisyncoccales bacterium]